MPYTTTRDIELIEIGSLGKETLSNDAFENLSKGISGTATIPLTGTTYTLTTEEAQAFVLILTGVLTANFSLTVPAASRVFIVDNRTTGAFDVSLFPSAGGGVAALQGERTLVYCDGANVYPVASGSGGGGGSGAPTDASYLVSAAHALLSGERVMTDTATVEWDFATAAQAKATIPAEAITFALMQPIAEGKLLGRFGTGAGEIQLVTPSTGLLLDGAGNLAVTSSGGQPADATLDALAGLATGADQLPYFTGTDTASQTPLTPFARTILDDTTQAAVRTTLALTPGTNVQAQDATLQAIAGLTPGANQMIFFTATDAASTTQITTFARSLLDDNNANQARQTLGITATGAPSIPFTALLDVPTSYTGQGGKTVAVKTDQTGLEFITGASGFQPLDATLTALAGLATAVDTVPLFVGTDLASLMTVTAFARTLLDDLTAAAARITLGLVLGVDVQPLDPTLTALAGVTTGVDLMPFFTGADAANSTVLTGFARTLLDDDDAAEMRATLGISGTGGSTDFLGLTDTPDAYATHGGKTVTVKADATGLEFITPSASGAPTDAEYITSAVHASLSGERVLTDTATVTWDFSTPGEAKATAAGGGTASASVGASVQRVAVQSITASTNTSIIFDTELRDDANFWSSGNPTRLTVPSAGWYSITGFIEWSSATGSLRIINIRINGTNYIAVDSIASGGASQRQDIGAHWYCNAADYAEIVVYDAGTHNIEECIVSIVGLTAAPAGAQPYDLGLSWSGVLPASQVLMRYPFPRAASFPAGLTDSRGVAAVAATGSTTLDIQKNGTSVGSAVFAAAGTTATFTMASATSFAAGDILTIVAPASADATLADLGLALAGTRT